MSELAPGRYRKRALVIEAIRYLPHENCAAVAAFLGEAEHHPLPSACAYMDSSSPWIIYTLEGDMAAQAGDWIIKGVNGEFYPCKPDIFEKTYEPADGT
jgi:hypothetical protein